MLTSTFESSLSNVYVVVSLLLLKCSITPICCYIVESGSRCRLPPSDPLPLHCLARPWSTPVCHLHPQLCEEGTECPWQGQGGSPPGSLQCWGGAYRNLHCPGHTSRQDEIRDIHQCIWDCQGYEKETRTHGPNTGMLILPIATSSHCCYLVFLVIYMCD